MTCVWFGGCAATFRSCAYLEGLQGNHRGGEKIIAFHHVSMLAVVSVYFAAVNAVWRGRWGKPQPQIVMRATLEI